MRPAPNINVGKYCARLTLIPTAQAIQIAGSNNGRLIFHQTLKGDIPKLKATLSKR